MTFNKGTGLALEQSDENHTEGVDDFLSDPPITCSWFSRLSAPKYELLCPGKFCAFDASFLGVLYLRAQSNTLVLCCTSKLVTAFFGRNEKPGVFKNKKSKGSKMQSIVK